MSNILDYVQLTEAVSFDDMPVNELDVAVLNELAYLPLTKPQQDSLQNQFLPLGEVISHSDIDLEEVAPSFMITENRVALLKAVLASQRYQGLQFGYYVNDIDSLFEKQFAAVVAYLPSFDYYQLIFRGTDETLVGWKEDFNMTYMSEIPAQRSACQYLSHFLVHYPRSIIVSGHSKGGNLAIYAASFMPSELQQYLDRVYIFDSPGLHEHVLEREGYQQIRHKIKAYKPKESIVGVMLASDIQANILESKAKGILQHDLFNWQTETNQFVRVDELTHLSQSLQKTFTEWMTEYSKHDLKEMSDTFFDLFFSLGIDNLDDLKTVDLQTTKVFLEKLAHLDSRKKALLFDALKTLLGIYHQNSLDLTVKKGKLIWQDWLTTLQDGFEKWTDTSMDRDSK